MLCLRQVGDRTDDIDAWHTAIWSAISRGELAPWGGQLEPSDTFSWANILRKILHSVYCAVVIITRKQKHSGAESTYQVLARVVLKTSFREVKNAKMKMICVFQINFHRHKTDDWLMSQLNCEKCFDILLLNEQYRNKTSIVYFVSLMWPVPLQIEFLILEGSILLAVEKATRYCLGKEYGARNWHIIT